MFAKKVMGHPLDIRDTAVSIADYHFIHWASRGAKGIYYAAPADFVGRSLLCCIPTDVCFLQLTFN